MHHASWVITLTAPPFDVKNAQYRRPGSSSNRPPTRYCTKKKCSLQRGAQCARPTVLTPTPLLLKITIYCAATFVARSGGTTNPATNVTQKRIERGKLVLDAVPRENIKIFEQHRNNFLYMPPPPKKKKGEQRVGSITSQHLCNGKNEQTRRLGGGGKAKGERENFFFLENKSAP